VIFRIRHTTSYTFSKPVFLEPHILRLRPRCDAFQRLDEYDLQVDPAPAGRSDGYDAEGNNATVVWFDGLTRHLEIHCRSTVETLRPNPFDYLLTARETANLPADYPPPDQDALAPYRRVGGGKDLSEMVESLLETAGGDALAFISELNSRLYKDLDVVIREEGDPLDPGETLKRGEASCRDLTVLFMAVCRSVGIACRFVSGYQEGDPGQDKRYMHAWPEVYLPGAGWRGYDPTHGLAVSDRHVSLASGATAIAAVPTQGSFRGTEARSDMKINLAIETSLGG
jgi:transglutaminase-like putative cysteine protease